MVCSLYSFTEPDSQERQFISEMVDSHLSDALPKRTYDKIKTALSVMKNL